MGHGSPLPDPYTALDAVLAQVTPFVGRESVALAEAAGRVLASDVTSPLDIPAWDHSAMDGYAIRLADLDVANGRLPVTQEIAAGCVGKPLAAGTAARIFTGAPLPPGADTVVIQEACRRAGDCVTILQDVTPGANIRRQGEEIRAGARVLEAGTRLLPQHLGLAATLGHDRLEVCRQVRVAILTTGNELIMPGQSLAPGQIYNANLFSLDALARTLGAEVVTQHTVADTLTDSCAALRASAATADLIIASGGVSVGDYDHLGRAVEQLGTRHLNGVAMRPGKPVVVGELDGSWLLGCPGNPVSLMVVFMLFARPLILRLQGVTGERLAPPRYRLRAAFDWPRPDRRRREFHRAQLQTGSDGAPELIVHPSRSSAALSSLTWADGLVDIAPQQYISTGDLVDFLPFSGLLG